MTREQFQNQFDREVMVDDYLQEVLQFDQIMFDTAIFRALQKLIIIKDDGKYYISA